MEDYQMKIIGYRLDNEYENGHIVRTKKFLTVIKCCGLEIKEYDGNKLSKENNYRVYLRCPHPSENYFIISNQEEEDGSYKWLTLQEAENIIERAIPTDTIDLREMGDYHICHEEHMQTVMIANDYDEIEDEPLPIIVKVSNQ